MTALELSLVIPVLNERDSLPALFTEIGAALHNIPHEIILIDDGSTDGSDQEIARLARQNNHVRAIFFTKNFGQTAALAAGFGEARGAVIVPMDADGQNDPQDIPRLLQKLSEGYDVVSGWRYPRRDPFFSRRLPSAIANIVISKITGVSLHDYGCTLKAYRRSVLENLRLYGEMHRFLPAWCAWKGAKMAELKVHHRPRLQGHSKYNIFRTAKVLLDLLTTKFISGYLSKPSYMFGGLAILFYLIGGLSGVFVFYDKFGPDRWVLYRIPLLLLSVLLAVVGTLLLMMGLIAELIVRLYYELTAEKPFVIRDKIGQF
jgi:glycosyltransferase involved in cell wall biosynthesis